MIQTLTRAHVGALVRLLQATWPDWYGPSGQGDVEADLTARCGQNLPRGSVAIRDVPVATVALAPTSFGARPGEAQWLTGLCTAPHMRRRGIGSALIAAVENDTKGPLHTTTREAIPLFAARGWQRLRDIEDGWQVWRR